MWKSTCVATSLNAKSRTLRIMEAFDPHAYWPSFTTTAELWSVKIPPSGRGGDQWPVGRGDVSRSSALLSGRRQTPPVDS